MKRFLRGFLATTGLSLLLLAAVAGLYQARFICRDTILQTGLANLVIHLGLALLSRFESRYFLVEAALGIGYVLAVLITMGCLFDWYGSTPPWVLALMGVAVYVAGCLIDSFRIRSDIRLINRQLARRDAGTTGPIH